MKIALSAESTADLTQELKEKYNVNTIGFHVLLEKDEYTDGQDINALEMFEFVEKTGKLPKTSAISEFEYTEYFSDLLKNNDKVLHFSLSSNLSVSYQNAKKVADTLGNIEVIDSKSLSTGIGLLVLSASDKIKAGVIFDEIVKAAHQEIENVQASFILNTLTYMHKGGRCSTITLLGANVLKIKPEIKLIEGEMIVGKKYRGKLGDVLNNYADDVLTQNNPDKRRVFITYSSYPEEAESLLEKVKAFGFEEVLLTNAGATICSHCGPKTLGILFINKGK
jgi:DegV family protein with EDD domain